ncbi:hypothetical protein ACFWEJ_01840 [Promicromonospora sp. NPDC060204]|uniref:hypothetical protein n=1 Tax=Promicromonospora sp. NPDC060204 TaxID=3347071 RepID=UPI00364D6C13
MPVPDVIPIAYKPDYRTDTIGRFEGGQFLACVTSAFREGRTQAWGPWEEHKHIFAVLHTFDAVGRHLGSDIWCSGTYSEQRRLQETSPGDDPVTRAYARLDQLLEALPGREYADIAIRPFLVEFDQARFGLVIEQHGEDETEDNWAELYPNQLGFSEPWDGNYDT